MRTRCNFGGTAATYTATRHAETVVGRRIDEHVEWTEKLLSRVAEAHAEFEEELARTAMSADHDQAEEVFATYNAAITGLRQEAPALPYGEVKERLGLSMRQGLMFPEAELELLAHAPKDECWRWHHPLEAVVWMWRHRRSAPLSIRLRQLRSGEVRFAG